MKSYEWNWISNEWNLFSQPFILLLSMLIYSYKYIQVALLCRVGRTNCSTILKIYIEQFSHFKHLCVAFSTKFLLRLFSKYGSADPHPPRSGHLDKKDAQWAKKNDERKISYAFGRHKHPKNWSFMKWNEVLKSFKLS